MIEDNFESNFYLKVLTVKNVGKTSVIYIRTVYRPRDAIPRQVWDSFKWNINGRGEIENKKADESE